MPDLNTDVLVTESLARRLDGVEPPMGDLAAVTRQGRRMRHRRTGLVATTGLAAVACGAVVAGQAMVGGSSGGAAYASLGALDLSKGLRAYSVDDGKVYLAGRSFDEGDVTYLDTSASTVRAGVVFFDSKLRPHLLDKSGDVSRLGDGSTAGLTSFRPTAMADVNSSVVGWTVRHDDRVQVVLYDLDSREQIGTRDVPCDGEACDRVRLDGLDGGLAFVRAPEGTFVWDRSDDSWTMISGPGTRVASVHNKVLLHDGPAPDKVGPLASGWRFVRGAIDAQLTFDGQHVLNWSSTLKSTTPGGADLRLDVPGDGEGFYTFDSDGSILVAIMNGSGRADAVKPDWPATEPGPDTDHGHGTEPGDEVTLKVVPSEMVSPKNPAAGYPSADDSPETTTFFDCEIPSGTCEQIGDHPLRHGDPVFIGNDL